MPMKLESTKPKRATKQKSGHATHAIAPTLRDYFAAAAIVGVLGNHETMRFWFEEYENALDVAAERAFEIADAMLEARELSECK